MTVTTQVVQFSGNLPLHTQVQILRQRETALLELKRDNEHSWWHFYNLFDEVKKQYESRPSSELRDQLFDIAKKRDHHESLAQQINHHIQETQEELQQYQPHIPAAPLADLPQLNF